jgi:2-polyprenyl-3-methyl-5-hydroxy-6-metoxy-1,4-benzoquinol methylase
MTKFTPHFIIPEQFKQFLTGSSFSNLHKFHIVKKSFILDRNELLLHLVANRKVLHFGCCDHLNLIEEKITNGSHLHTNITKVATECVGLDINEESLTKLSSLGVSNCYYYDLLSSNNSFIENKEYDFVLLGEILEHIPNPVEFLNLIAKKFVNAKEIIVTVPNAFSTKNFYNIKQGVEEINTDHKYWFTPYTIAKVLTVAGYDANNIYFVDRSRISLLEKFVKWFYLLQGKNPFTSKKWSISKATGLVAIAKFNAKS